MEPVLTAVQMAAIDAHAISTLGLDARILMSNAAMAVLSAALQRWPDARRILVLAGPGNNGGDGLALAFYAQQRGLEVRVWDAREHIPEDDAAATQSAAEYWREICRHSFVPMEQVTDPDHLLHTLEDFAPDIIVDALFGTGLNRPVSEYYNKVAYAAYKATDTYPQPIVAIDLPSGMSADTGTGALLRAQLTVTLGYMKLGLLHAHAAVDAGEIVVRRIGLESEELRAAAGVQPQAFRETEFGPPWFWTHRSPQHHKNHYGRVLIVAGHSKYPGAPRLAAGAALRMGAGLVRLVVPQPIHLACCDDPSVMCAPHTAAADGGFAAAPDTELLEYLDWADALIIGPGLGDGAALELARALIGRRDIPTVVDADALRLFSVPDGLPERASSDAPMTSSKHFWPLLLTPHAGELARCLGISTAEGLADWFGSVRKLAAHTGALVLAKAHQSVLAMPDGTLYFPPAGHPALATGGSGDVLSGMLGSLLALRQASWREVGGSPVEGPRALLLHAIADHIMCAVGIHSLAGRHLAATIGENSATATDLIAALPEVLRSADSG